MKRFPLLALGAGLAFAVSFFLPALDSSSGAYCFGECWQLTMRSDGNGSISPGGWLYYTGFVAANVVFVLLCLGVFWSRSFPRARLVCAVAALLQVLSWLVLNLAHGEQSSLKIGYYLWLGSFVLLVAAHLGLVRAPVPPAVAGDGLATGSGHS